MTNREKYINNMTNKELALFLSCGSQIIDNYIDINPSMTDDEELRKQAARNCNDIEKWLSQEAEITADEMFGELGYVKETGNDEDFIRYHNLNNDDRIYVEKSRGEIVFSKISGCATLIASITEAEDKAIHKKIEELKKNG